MESILISREDSRQTQVTTEAKNAVAVQVEYVPTFGDFPNPTNGLMKALNWPRQISEFVGAMVSGAASLR